MDKFEEYFRTTKHYENMLLEIARNQLSVSVFDKNGRKYRNHIVQTAYEVFQHQQAKVDELKASHHGEVIGHEVHFKKIKQERDELQTLYIQQGINMLKLQKQVEALTQTMEEVLEEMKYPTATFEEVIVCGVKVLEQALKGEG
ncbi:hypothetical protein [Acinetobacter baumannii]|uniref:hypothetical protein n=1 Tax=Acinetobacter baumannii TaxID=470 RepID=UPI00280C9D6D|nr:hypothetical protein [Acinetobacter baumannii]MDQ8959196.1 hypothetical protein [Acinetobacter baumannii]